MLLGFSSVLFRSTKTKQTEKCIWHLSGGSGDSLGFLPLHDPVPKSYTSVSPLVPFAQCCLSWVAVILSGILSHLCSLKYIFNGDTENRSLGHYICLATEWWPLPMPLQIFVFFLYCSEKSFHFICCELLLTKSPLACLMRYLHCSLVCVARRSFLDGSLHFLSSCRQSNKSSEQRSGMG